jgi:hypothetical protein
MKMLLEETSKEALARTKEMRVTMVVKLFMMLAKLPHIMPLHLTILTVLTGEQDMEIKKVIIIVNNF